MCLKIDIPVEVSGRFKCDVLRKDGSVSRSTGWFENLVLDTGLARMQVGGQGFNICRVGTGSSTPLPTDQALDSQIAFTGFNSQSTGNINLENGYAWTTVIYEFPLGGVVGNVAEIGTGWQNSTSGTLFSRALVKDTFGNPTTITILADEILRVTWEHRRYWPAGDFTGTIANIGNHGGSYNWTARASGVSEYWSAGEAAQCGFQFANIGTTVGTNTLLYYGGSELGPITGRPTGTPAGSGTITTQSTTPGTFSASARLSFSLAQSNGNLRCIMLFARNAATSVRHIAWQYRFDPAIPKTANDLLEIDLGFSWARRP